MMTLRPQRPGPARVALGGADARSANCQWGVPPAVPCVVAGPLGWPHPAVWLARWCRRGWPPAGPCRGLRPAGSGFAHSDSVADQLETANFVVHNASLIVC